ncbi:unnamed protein product, partial [marine sediment metagenome]
NLVARSIRGNQAGLRDVRELPAAVRTAPSPQELVLRRSYQVAAEEAVRELERGEEVARRFREEDERSRAKLAVDANRLGDVESCNGSHFYFGRSGTANQYTTEEAAAMEARIKRNIAKANLLTEFSTPAHFSSFPYC